MNKKYPHTFKESKNWLFIPDISNFCSLIYESEHRDISNPFALYKKRENSLIYNHLSRDWERVSQVPGFENKKSYKFIIGGLVIDIWRYRKNQHSNVFVLIFRGSDRNWDDWWNNARWITRFIPFTFDQYNQVIEYIPEIISKLKIDYPNIEIIAAGHSLGGGLAQLAGYCSPDVSTVYAFNSSPVTGYFSVKRKTRNKSKKKLKIFRIHEKSEALNYFRDFMKILWPISKKDPEIICIQYNFTHGNGIQKHRMDLLAQNINNQGLDKLELLN